MSDPTPEQMERAVTALLPFVTEWGLSLNPEDLHEIAYAVVAHFDSSASHEEILAAVEHQLAEAHADPHRSKDLDGFTLRRGPKILARMVMQDMDMPWFECTFEPTVYFAEVKPLFDAQEQALREEDWDRVEELIAALDRHDVTVQRFGAAELPTSEFLLRIDGAQVRVRYEPDPRARLVDPARYRDEQPVVIEAHRGTRRASVRREHDIPETLFARLVALGRAYELEHVGGLDPCELDRAQARELAHDLEFLERVCRDPVLLGHITELRGVVDFCWRAEDDAWLTIAGL